MQPEKLYHIYNHANGNENLFRDVENYRYFLRQWAKYIDPIAHTLSYCLMPNHFHFLIEVKTLEVFENLQGLKQQNTDKLIQPNVDKMTAQSFSNLFNSYTKAFNKKYVRKGSLFSPNFKQKEVTSNDYITKVIAYIHTNPIHHGFTQNLKDWSFSSYETILSEKPTKIARQRVLNWFGGKPAFQDFHQAYINTLPSEDMNI